MDFFDSFRFYILTYQNFKSRTRGVVTWLNLAIQGKGVSESTNLVDYPTVLASKSDFLKWRRKMVAARA